MERFLAFEVKSGKFAERTGWLRRIAMPRTALTKRIHFNRLQHAHCESDLEGHLPSDATGDRAIKACKNLMHAGGAVCPVKAKR